MSCKDPHFIENKKFRNTNNLSLATRTSVPCGKCSGCLVGKRNELANLIETEQLANLLAGGSCAFITFTYDDDHLPNMLFMRDTFEHHFIIPCGNQCDFTKISDKPYITIDTYRGKTFADNRNRCSVPFADYRDVQNFFKTVRKTLSRINPEFELRYVFASEYGTDPRYTMRPHFHALLFLNKPLAKHFGAHHKSIAFQSFLAKYWHNGLISASKQGLWVDGSCGTPAYYVSKYVVKSNDVTQHPHYQRFYSFYKANKTAFTNYFVDYFYKLDSADVPASFDVDYIFRFFHLKNKIRKSLRFGHAQLPYIEKFLSSENIQNEKAQFQLSCLFPPIPFSKYLIKFVINHAETEKKKSYFVNALRYSVNNVACLLSPFSINGQRIRPIDIACYLLFYNRHVLRASEYKLNYSNFDIFTRSLLDVLDFKYRTNSVDFTSDDLSPYEPYHDVLPYDIVYNIEEIDRIINVDLKVIKRDDVAFYLHLLK